MTADNLRDHAIDKRFEFVDRLRRHEDPTYVYTYPYKGAYRPVTSWQSAIESWNLSSGPLNLYIHIPFCDMKCSFCNLFTTTQHTSNMLSQYIEAVLDEAAILSEFTELKRYEVDSLYLGGGTPTLLSLKEMEKLVLRLRELFIFRPSAELAIESAPNSVQKQKLKELHRFGVQRISFGVQSFDPTELLGMGRTYEATLGEQMASAAIDLGFRNVNLDLIYGLPGQSVETWLKNLETAAALGAPTITIYPLTLRSRTIFGKAFETEKKTFPRKISLYHFYDTAVNYLSNLGYEQHTTVMFAKPNGGSHHELNEFAGVPTLGLGAAALTYAPTFHYTSGYYFESKPTSEIFSHYFQAIKEHTLPIRCGFLLDKIELQRRFIILRLLSSGFDRGEYTAKFNETIESHFETELNILRNEGCLNENSDWVLLSGRGRRFSSLVADLFASDTVKYLAASYR